jgi:hypothetical protein
MNIAPAGFERFFAEVAEEWAQPERDMSRITAISDKYTEFIPSDDVWTGFRHQPISYESGSFLKPLRLTLMDR